MADAFATAFDEAEKQYNSSSFKSAFDEAESEWKLSAQKTAPSGDFFKERFKVGALDVPEKPPTTLSELPIAVAEEAKGLAGTLVRPVTTLEKGVVAALAEAGILTPKQYAKTWHTIDQPLRIPTLPKAESMAGKISSGVASAAIDFVNAFIDPDAIALIGLGGVPGATQKVILGTFAAEMATAAPQQLQAATEAAKRGDWQEAVRQTTGGIGGTMLSAHLARKTIEPAGGVRAMSEETAALIPETAKAAGIQVEPAPVPIKVEPVIEAPKPELQPATPELKAPVLDVSQAEEWIADRLRGKETPSADYTIEGIKRAMGLTPEQWNARIAPMLDSGLILKTPEGFYRFNDRIVRLAETKPAEVVPPVEKGPENARPIASAESVSEHEVRPRVGEEAPLRQPGEPAVPRPEAEREAPQAPPAELKPAEPEPAPTKFPWLMTGQELKDLADRLVAERQAGGSTAAPFHAWEVTRKAYVDYAKIEGKPPIKAGRTHAEHVRRAIERRNVVPPEVLADYPNLQPKPTRLKPEEGETHPNAFRIGQLKRELSEQQKKLDRNVAKMGTMVPPPIVAEVTRKISNRMAKIQDEIDRLEKPLVGMGGAVKGEIPEQPQGAAKIVANLAAKEAVSAKEAASMEAKVKVKPAEDIDKLEKQFALFDKEIGDALSTGGQFLPKELRPEVAKGAPAEPETVVSKRINQYFSNKLLTLVNEVRRVRDEIAKQARKGEVVPELEEYLDLVLDRAKYTFQQSQEIRRTSSESLYFWNSIKAETQEIMQALGIARDLKARIPILDSLWKHTRGREWRRAGKDLLEFLRVNLFTLGSWTLDFATNLAVASTKLPAFAMGDMVSLMRGNSASRMAAALQSARMSAKNLVPGERFRLSQEVETRLGTVAGSEFQGYGKEVMVDFSEILKGKPDAAEQLKKIDILLSAPVRMKRATDNFFGRMGAATELYHGAYEAAKQAGLKGEDMQIFVENFIKTPPKEAIDAAVKEGKEWKFNRDLSEWEEKFAANTITKLAIEAFPRWTLQFSRWAGEMLGLNPTLYRKIKEGRATQQEVIDGLTKAATGWGGIVLFNNLIYDNIDAQTMEYVKEDGDRVRLSGRTPAPELFFITALLRGDFQKAKAALPQTSIPLAKLLGNEPGGIVSPVVDAMRESVRGRYTAERTVGELTKLINNAIPGKSVLGFIRSLYDPTIREGLGAPIPGVAGLLPQKIEPTTGEPAAPKQKIPGTSFTFPTVGGTPFPGAVRDLNAIQAVLMNHGLAVTRPRRTSIIELPAEDVPKEYRREYEKLAGQNVKRILGEAIVQPEFWQSPPEIRTKLLQNWLNIARNEARNAMAEKYHTGTKPVKSPPIRVELMPERFKPSTQPK